MEETKEVIFKSMREASEYFEFPYSGKSPERNDKYLSCYCDWERISRNYIKAKQIYEIPKEFKRQSTRKYKYKVGDIISSTNSSFRVLKQIRIYRDKNRNGVKETVNEKGYFVKCVKDGYEFEVLESALSRNYGCPVCSNRKVIKGINDVATTNPEIAALFENIEDAYTTTYSTKKKFRFKCPRCGYVKLDDTNHITHFGFSCPCCSDGVSFPNKFVGKLLTDLGVNYDRETRFSWCKYPCFVNSNKLDYGSYDFVIPDMNIIIEADGGLGHGRKVMTTIRHNRRKITIEETLYRDKMKDKLAITNGYKIIRINCVYNGIHDRCEKITNGIKESELASIFDLSNIDFQEIGRYCTEHSYIIEAKNLWNKGHSISEIATQLKIAESTVKNHLITMNKMNMCEYHGENQRLQKVSGF